MPLPIAALFFQPAPQRLHPADLAVVALYLAGITLFGLRFRKRGGAKGSSLQSYFLADNTVPWWAIALSIVSAETSTLTIISIPGIAFGGDFGFLQVVMGYMLGRVVVAALFLPRYFAGHMLTAYQLIDRRFGPTLHKVTAGLFLCTRAAAEGVRVFAVSIVVGIAIGTGDVLSIAIISALTLLYTFEGGMAAVIWTDVVQMAIYIAGTLVAVWSLGHHVRGGWSTILHAASAAGKLHTFDFAANLTSPAFWAKSYTFWAGLLGGTFLTMASHGTDQLMVQRMLAARNLRESRLALLSSGVVVFFQFTLFLLIGVGLWAFYTSGNTLCAPFIAQSHRAMSGIALPSAAATRSVAELSPDRIFPTFIVRELPTGVAGLLVAAILAAAMSNLSAALNSLSSSTVVDFYMHARPHAEARERNLVSRASTVVWALVLFALAVYSLSMGGKGHVVETGLSIASVAYGALLGVFLLGTLTRFATETGAAIGMVFGFTLNMLLWLPTITPLRTIGLLGGHAIPHIAFTWYVLIGAAVTFAVGSLASLILPKSQRAATPVVTLLVLVILSGAFAPWANAQSKNPEDALTQHIRSAISAKNQGQPGPDFTPVDNLLTTAIASGKLPGAVVVIGHSGHIVYEHAYGLRKLAGEPGLDGKPSPVEPMTEDTIFDMASLTKCLATATAVMQLYEAGKIPSFDDPVQKYLPDFNVSNDPQRAKVTLRLLLTHFSGEPADVNLKDPWGLSSPDKAEGIHRALTTPLQSAPAATFRYSDINFILLGALVEKLSGEPEDRYVAEHVSKPLGMTDTRYLPVSEACGDFKYIPAYSLSNVYRYETSIGGQPVGGSMICKSENWNAQLFTPRTAPTAHDDESKANPAGNPNFDRLLRGTVHDPTTRRMGGVAGHAGVFSTAHDMSLFAQALLDRLAGRPSTFPLKQSTLQLMTTPEQPGHTPAQLAAANAATNTGSGAPSVTASSSRVGSPGSQAAPSPDPLLAPNYPAIKNQDLRAFGWDIDTAYSKPRGRVFPIGSFGHTGFTGTSLWLDPGSDTYVILLANAIHPRGNPPISALRGEVATAAAQSLHLYVATSAKATIVPDTTGVILSAARSAQSKEPEGAGTLDNLPNFSVNNGQGAMAPRAPLRAEPRPTSHGPNADSALSPPEPWALDPGPSVQTGIDVLESTSAAAVQQLKTANKSLKLGLLTNQSGLDSQGHRTIDYLASLTTKNLELTTLFSPEHGIAGAHDTETFAAETDSATGLHITSLYGPHDADRRPTHAQLASLNAVVIDLQDAGVRTYTYPAVVGYFLEAAAIEKSTYHHDLAIVVLDRPNLIDGSDVQGPVSDPGHEESYADYMQMPVRHGLTLGEFARYVNGERHLDTHLVVVPMQHWQRPDYFDQTALPWTNPSPNLRNQTAAELLPALTLLETTNLSVGRGTGLPFELFGAGTAAPSAAAKKPAILSEARSAQPKDSEGASTRPSSMPHPGQEGGSPSAPSGPWTLGPKPSPSWFQAADVAAALTARHIPGVAFEPTTTQVDDDPIHPFHGQTIEAVRIRVTDRTVLDSPELGVEILSAVHKLYPADFKLARAATLLASQATLDALTRGDDPRAIAAGWKPSLEAFRHSREPYLLYR